MNPKLSLHFRKPIPPLLTTLGWQSVPIRECGDPLISVAEFDPSKIVQISSYFAQGFQRANRELFVRKKAGEMLLAVANALPSGLRIAVFDAWRSLELQQEIFSKYMARLRRTDSTASTTRLVEEAQKYVSVPAEEPNHPAPHITGGAVDVTLCDQEGHTISMGTDFDHFGPEAATRYFEEETYSNQTSIEGDGPLQNRRLLFNAMVDQGFTNYSEEWWHFDYGNQFWAHVNRVHAIYGPARPNA